MGTASLAFQDEITALALASSPAAATTSFRASLVTKNPVLASKTTSAGIPCIFKMFDSFSLT